MLGHERAVEKIIRAWPWPLTLNEGYDRQTKAIIRQVCSPSSNCIDVGCFQGDILECMIQSAPEGRHIAFEPIPVQFQLLQKNLATPQLFILMPWAMRMGPQHLITC